MVELVSVNERNVDETGFFCLMSKPESEGYGKKLEWLKARFSEGLRIKLIRGGGRGFIEYIPGEYAWRAIRARDYMVIHCLWVVGKSKSQGCGTALLNECIREAQGLNMAGVAAVTATHQTGLTDTGFFLHHGFELVDSAPSGLDLVALRFREAPPPEFVGDWDRKLEALGPGLSVVYAAQCPYMPELAEKLAGIAQSEGIPAQVVELKSVEEVRERAPSAYGVFGIAYKGTLLGRLYHNVNAEKLTKAVRSCEGCAGLPSKARAARG